VRCASIARPDWALLAHAHTDVVEVTFVPVSALFERGVSPCRIGGIASRRDLELGKGTGLVLRLASMRLGSAFAVWWWLVLFNIRPTWFSGGHGGQASAPGRTDVPRPLAQVEEGHGAERQDRDHDGHDDQQHEQCVFADVHQPPFTTHTNQAIVEFWSICTG
jgi:hypothetical protein